MNFGCVMQISTVGCRNLLFSPRGALLYLVFDVTQFDQLTAQHNLTLVESRHLQDWHK